MIILYRGQTML